MIPGAAGVPRLLLRLHIPRAEELPAGLARCGGWGDGTLMYISDRHCEDMTPHPPHLVLAGVPSPLPASSMLQLVSGMAQTSMVTPLSIRFDGAPGASPLMRLKLPAEQRDAVALYGRLFGLPEPTELGWINRAGTAGRSFVAENMAPGRELFCGWRVDVSCFVTADSGSAS